MKRARENRAIPEGWALDPEGRPTADADLHARIVALAEGVAST